MTERVEVPEIEVDLSEAPDVRKLAELILYIAQRSEDDERFGAVKLNKILFYSDFLAYALEGTSITNHPYRRLPRGPAPKYFLQVREKMEERGDLAIQRRRYFDREQERPIALREPDLEGFTGSEIAIVDDVIDRLWDKDATEASELSHRFKGWELAEDGEDIPYETVFVNTRPLTDSEKEYGRKLAAEELDGGR